MKLTSQTVLTLHVHIRVLDLGNLNEAQKTNFVASSFTELDTKGAHRIGLNVEATAKSNISYKFTAKSARP